MGLSRTELLIFISEAICILFYGLFVVYGDETNAGADKGPENDGAAKALMYNHYPMF